VHGKKPAGRDRLSEPNSTTLKPARADGVSMAERFFPDDFFNQKIKSFLTINRLGFPSL
jgi:hypothetical protein